MFAWFVECLFQHFLSYDVKQSKMGTQNNPYMYFLFALMQHELLRL